MSRTFSKFFVTALHNKQNNVCFYFLALKRKCAFIVMFIHRYEFYYCNNCFSINGFVIYNLICMNIYKLIFKHQNCPQTYDVVPFFIDYYILVPLDPYIYLIIY